MRLDFVPVGHGRTETIETESTARNAGVDGMDEGADSVVADLLFEQLGHMA